jgi:hypothetical protein
VEEGGARRATFTAGLCWAGGFLLSAVGVYMHNIWMVCLGYGVLGGFGLGIQLHLADLHPDPMVPPSSWVGDRNGDHGFGGGAFIASPLPHEVADAMGL